MNSIARSPLASLAATFRQNVDFLLDSVSARRRDLRRLRDQWGRPGEKDEKLAGRYFELTRDASAAVVDDKTWTDLEFPKIFADMAMSLPSMSLPSFSRESSLRPMAALPFVRSSI